ncbi:hypothetical protein [Azospirillum palustre]
MGEAKKRKSFRDRLIEIQPMCVYCGGNVRAVDVDHMPPRSVFDRKYRPKGLEFPSCKACNAGSAGVDQIVGMMCRIYQLNRSNESEEEIAEIITGVKNNYPRLLEEMLPSFSQRLHFYRVHGPTFINGSILNASGPILSKAMDLFGAKAGLALHYHETSQIVPETGGVAVKWFSNYDAATGEIPKDLIEILGELSTLRQGRIEVSDQFKFKSVCSEDGDLWLHWMSFRTSFAICAFSSASLERLKNAPATSIFRPGCFSTRFQDLRFD